MQRRSVVIALGASAVSLTGCIGQSSPQNNSREVHISSVDKVPSESPLEPTVEMLRSSVTADETARVQVTVTNTTDQPVWNSTVRIPAFDRFVTEEGPQGQRLLLLQPDGAYDTVRSDCWRADLDSHGVNHAYTDVVTDRQYRSGETRTTAFDIFGHPENTGPCLPPGNYRIGSSYRIAEVAEPEAAEWEFDWGFTVGVEES